MEKGSTVVIFGLGAIGLAVLYIIDLDIFPVCFSRKFNLPIISL